MKKISLTVMTLALLFVGASSIANAADNKVIEKARTAVENASPDDWYAYAKSAQMCIRKNVNMKEAAEWLDKSLEIKKDVFNLEVKGDYYVKNNLPEKALKFYVEAAKIAKENDVNYDTSGLQAKIAKTVKS
jgi:tetratricopeptide (TPR) repeat protein